MDYNLFDYVLHKDNVCILVDYNDSICTLLHIHFYGTDGTFLTIEYDAKLEEINLYEEEVSPMVERLRSYRMSHDDSFGFVDEELALIHYF